LNRLEEHRKSVREGLIEIAGATPIDGQRPPRSLCIAPSCRQRPQTITETSPPSRNNIPIPLQVVSEHVLCLVLEKRIGLKSAEILHINSDLHQRS